MGVSRYPLFVSTMLTPSRQPNKRILTLEQKFEHIARLKLEKLGAWNARKRKAISKAKLESQKVLDRLEKDGWTPPKLEEQWELQKKDQLSVSACEQCLPFPCTYL